MGENQCPHCGRVVTGFEQLDLVHEQACEAAKDATIEAELSRYQTLHFESGQQLLNEAARAERLEAENARLRQALNDIQSCNGEDAMAQLAANALGVGAALASAQPAGEASPDEKGGE